MCKGNDDKLHNLYIYKGKGDNLRNICKDYNGILYNIYKENNDIMNNISKDYYDIKCNIYMDINDILNISLYKELRMVLHMVLRRDYMEEYRELHMERKELRR